MAVRFPQISPPRTGEPATDRALDHLRTILNPALALLFSGTGNATAAGGATGVAVYSSAQKLIAQDLAAGTGWQDITDLTLNITTTAGQTVILLLNGDAWLYNSGWYGGISIWRDGVNLAAAKDSGFHVFCAYDMSGFGPVVVDSPAPGPHTWKVRGICLSGHMIISRTVDGYGAGGGLAQLHALVTGAGKATSGGGGTRVANEVPASTVTPGVYTLAYTPIAGTESIYWRGQRLTPTTDYTMAGAAITTLEPISDGLLLVDYWR